MRVEAARRLFPSIWFNESTTTKAGAMPLAGITKSATSSAALAWGLSTTGQSHSAEQLWADVCGV